MFLVGWGLEPKSVDPSVRLVNKWLFSTRIAQIKPNTVVGNLFVERLAVRVCCPHPHTEPRCLPSIIILSLPLHPQPDASSAATLLLHRHSSDEKIYMYICIYISGWSSAIIYFLSAAVSCPLQL